MRLFEHDRQVLWQPWTTQKPFESITNPWLQRQLPSCWRAALVLQVVQPSELAFVQVLQVIWQPTEIQFPVTESKVNPVLHLQLKSDWRAAFDLQVKQLFDVAPEQVLQLSEQVWQKPWLST